MWSSHAGTSERLALAVACHWAHMLGATVWVGGLAALVMLARRPDSNRFAVLVSRFSTIAGWALAVALGSGIVTSTLHMSAVDQLRTTTCGRLLLIKMVIFAGIAALGAYNRFRMLPPLRAASDEAAAVTGFRRVAFSELGLMVLAFGAATSLATSLPAATEAATRADTEMTSQP